MPSVKFTNKDSLVFDRETVPPGDYAVEVIKCDASIRTGGKCNGCDAFDFQLRLVDNPKCTFYEDMVFGRENLQWKIDVILKSLNFLYNGKPLVAGQEFSIEPEDMIGLRGWATLKVRDYTKDMGNGKTEPRTVNEVAVWLTNKEKLARNKPAEALPTKTEYGF